MKVRELMVRVGVATDGDKLDQFESKLDDVKSAVGDLAGWLKKLAAGYAAVTGAAGAVAMKTAEWSEEVVRNADALGMSTDKYQELHFAFSNLGASTDDMMDAFSTLTDRALDAAEGSKTYIDEFNRLGISIDEIRGKRPDQIFDIYTTAAQNAEDRTDAVASAVRLFGDDLGRRIMPALTTAAEDFNEWKKIARETGIVMDEAFVRKARKIRMEWRALGGRFKAILYTLGQQLMPVFETFVERLNLIIDGFLESGEGAETFSKFAELLWEDLEKLWDVGTRLAEALGFAFDDAEEPAERLYHTVKLIIAAITGSAFASVVASVLSLFATVGVGAVATIAAKAVAIAAAVGVVLLIAEDIFGYFMGWESVTGNLLENFGEGGGMMDSLARLSKELKRTWVTFKPVVMGILDLVWDLAKNALSTVWSVLKTVLSIVFDIWTFWLKIINTVGEFFSLLFDGQFKKAFEKLISGILDVYAHLLRSVINGLLSAAMTVAKGAVGMLAPLLEKLQIIDDNDAFMESMTESMTTARDNIFKSLTFNTEPAGKAVTEFANDSATAGAVAMTPASRAGQRRGPSGLEAIARSAPSVRTSSPQPAQTYQANFENVTIGESLSKPRQQKKLEDSVFGGLRKANADASGGER